jgi:TolB protein
MKPIAWAIWAGVLAGPAVAAPQLVLEGEAEAFMPGMVTRAHHEVQASTHPAGRLVLFGCSDCPDGAGHDLWQAQLHQGQWLGPGRAKPSTKRDESAPAFSPEGGWLYYVADHPNGTGGLDLYRVAYYVTRDSFATPESLGPAINSAGDEGAASPGPHGEHLVFASRGRPRARGWDLFESRRVDGKMTPAVPLATLNTRRDEFDPALLADDAGLVFARRESGKRTALWFAPRQGAGFGEPVRLGAPVNLPDASARAPQQDLRDPAYLLFTRVAADGSSDILRVRYRVQDAPGEEGGDAADDR